MKTDKAKRLYDEEVAKARATGEAFRFVLRVPTDIHGYGHQVYSPAFDELPEKAKRQYYRRAKAAA